MKADLIIASRNQGKIREFNTLLAHTKFQPISMEDVGYNDQANETGDTLEKNALIKALAIFEKTRKAVLSEDSGLFVKVLDGAPGVHSSRFAGTESTDEENIEKLLHLMKNEMDRSAKFMTVICFINVDGKPHFFNGEVGGNIAYGRSGDTGFGYDPIFIPNGYEESFADLGTEVKNSVSHRKKAIERFLEWLLLNDRNLN